MFLAQWNVLAASIVEAPGVEVTPLLFCARWRPRIRRAEATNIGKNCHSSFSAAKITIFIVPHLFLSQTSLAPELNISPSVAILPVDTSSVAHTAIKSLADLFRVDNHTLKQEARSNKILSRDRPDRGPLEFDASQLKASCWRDTQFDHETEITINTLFVYRVEATNMR